MDVLVSLVDALQDLTGIDFRSQTKKHVVWEDAASTHLSLAQCGSAVF